MPLFTNQIPEELQFLRLKAGPLSRRDMKSNLYSTLKSRMMATVLDTANTGVGLLPRRWVSASNLLPSNVLIRKENLLSFMSIP